MKSLLLAFVLLLTGCTRTEKPTTPLSESLSDIFVAVPKNTTTGQNSEAKPETKEVLTKEIREAFYFAASVEREALKLLTKNQTLDELTLFSVISYAMESNSGVKKSIPARLDCGRFAIRPNQANSIFEVFKTCSKPESLVARIERELSPSELKTTFFIKEWSSVVGLTSALTGTDVVCSLKIENKKLIRLSCENWVRTLSASAISAEEIKLKTFVFNRTEANQLILVGGVYKDLVERRKLEVRVPLEGKIKLIEKELEVIDQFADRIEQPRTGTVDGSRSQRVQIGGANDSQKKVDNQEANIQEVENQEEERQELDNQDVENQTNPDFGGGPPKKPTPGVQQPPRGR